jgi:hypothetical protein
MWVNVIISVNPCKKKQYLLVTAAAITCYVFTNANNTK